jgi:toxin CptA
MQALRVEWRGSLAFLRWRGPDGRIRRLVFWPDILPSTSRRELRLATMRVEPARETTSVAG